MKIGSRLKRALVASSLILIAVASVFFALVAIPAQFRLGIWQKLPVLDAKLLPHLSTLFAAVFGAFFGSLSAFYLGRIQQRVDRREKRHAALIAAQYALMTQWNMIEGIRIDHLEPVRADPSRFAKLPPFYFRASPTFVPFADLTFVLETKDPNILHEVHLAQQSFQSCVEALDQKNREVEKFYKNPRISHHIRDFKSGSGVAEASQQDVFMLQKAVDMLYVSVDRTLPRLTGAVEKLEKLIKSMFPGKQALRMVRDSPL